MSKQLELFDDMPKRARRSSYGIKVKDRLNNYEAFTDKFKPKKTTDDCYTPPAIYEAIIGWLKDEKLIDEATEIVRPFYPGKDYQAEEYPEGSVVVDNPPFSIYAQIVRWFIANEIKFFLFGPQLTLKVSGADICHLPVNASITYENGAVVNTGFVTNLIKGVRLWTAPSLHKAIRLASPAKQILPKNTYPLNVVTCATIGKVAAREVDYKIMADDCVEIKNLDALAAVKKTLFGGGAAAIRACGGRACGGRACGGRACGGRACGGRACGGHLRTTLGTRACAYPRIRQQRVGHVKRDKRFSLWY